jgi:hopene-associated glycosyltransferase HpnB
VAVAAAVVWLAVLLAPWRPWSTRERLEAAADAGPLTSEDAAAITTLIPARDESIVIGRTVAALRAQAAEMRIIVVDDQSHDDTAEVARAAGGARCDVIAGLPLPPGWVGKLWALEQGRLLVRTPLVLLVDADIELRPGFVTALLARRRADDRQLVSLMAQLEMSTPWEQLLIPAFIYFFKLLYPFRISNSPSRLVAAAAGGCVLVEAAVLDRIGGFGAIRDALIDDCALARAVKRIGGRTWIGLTHDAVSLRGTRTLGAIWHMVTRSAFAQLRFSTVLLAVCVALLGLAFWVPIAGLGAASPLARGASVTALVAMMTSYVPLLHYYRLSLLWALALPLAGTLYLGMTVSSAARSWFGVRSSWKGRTYRAR